MRVVWPKVTTGRVVVDGWGLEERPEEGAVVGRGRGVPRDTV